LLDYDLDATLIKTASDTTGQALSADTAWNQTDPRLTATFPTTSLGNQLKQMAKLIKIKDAVGITMKRQIFFCQLDGFDTHTNETSTDPTVPNGAGGQGNLLTQLSQAMRAFYDEMVA